MARDKLITIRIEGEKREAFNQLAKSQNTDTASLLYDFISGCLDGTLDVGIVTGKKQRIDKIDNQIDSERIDKLETTTQEIGERLDRLSQKLEDWIWVSQRSQENNLTELKDQINILTIQLDSQQDRQRENPNPNPTVEDAVETDLTIEGEDAIETIEENYSTVESGTGEGIENRQGLTNQQLHEKTHVSIRTIQDWANKIQKGKKTTSTKYPDFFKQWRLNLSDSLWYQID